MAAIAPVSLTPASRPGYPSSTPDPATSAHNVLTCLTNGSPRVERL
jgi:hypothetical protein